VSAPASLPKKKEAGAGRRGFLSRTVTGDRAEARSESGNKVSEPLSSFYTFKLLQNCEKSTEKIIIVL